MRNNERNKQKLKRMNAPNHGVESKILIYDEAWTKEAYNFNIHKTTLETDAEHTTMHPLYVAGVNKILNPESKIYLKDYQHELMPVVDWAINNGVRIINSSMSFPEDEESEKALKKYYEWGGIWVASAGNHSHRDMSYPGRSKYTIGVSATNTEDTDDVENVDITTDSCWKVYNHNGNLRTFCGTSASSPVIASVAQFYLDVNVNGNLDTFRLWLANNSTYEDDLLLNYLPPYGCLEDGEKYFIFPDDFKDDNVEEKSNKIVIKLHPRGGIYSGSKNYYVNDSEYTMDTTPIIDSNNRTLVPIRFIVEALGCEVTWDDSTGTVTIIEE